MGFLALNSIKNKKMGLDVDCIAGKMAIDELKEILISQNHGERGEIADEIIEFVEMMKEKFGKDKESGRR
jgi:hypothetical protein